MSIDWTNPKMVDVKAEIIRMAETSGADMYVDPAWLASLLDEHDALAEALRRLVDEQNGPPLVRNKVTWDHAMHLAEVALKDYEARK